MKKFIILIGAALLAGCRPGSPSTTSSDHGMAALERILENQRETESLVSDVEAWVVRMTSQTLPGDRDKIEGLTSGLRARLDRVKPALTREGFRAERSAILDREAADLKDAYNRAVASVGSERRRAEEQFTDASKEMTSELAQFRVDVASAGVQGNAEVKRRLAQMDLGRREVQATLAELKQTGVERWSSVERRWERQRRLWKESLNEARARLKFILPPSAETELR